MGKGIVEELKKEFEIEDEWISFELHPETPENGVLLKNIIPEPRINSMFEHLQHAGEPYGIKFRKFDFLPNSRKALEASEFAREKGLFKEFHDIVFDAYFTRGKNIGEVDIILELGKEVGLNYMELSNTLAESKYRNKISKGKEEGTNNGVTGIPTFIINNDKKIVGAQSLDVFRQTLLK